MKRRFRRAAALAAAATVAVTIAACSSSGTNTPSTTSSGPVTLTFWTWLGTSSMQALANDYTKLHPNVKINVVDVGSSAAEYTKLETAIKAWREGSVAAVHVGMGQAFQRGAPLISLAPQPEA